MPRRNRTRLARRKPNKNHIPFVKGHRLEVPNHPTEFCSKPWFSLVLRVRNPVASITQADIYNSMISQLSGLSFVGSVFNVRFMSVRMWGPIPVLPAALVMTIRDVFDEIVGTTGSGLINDLEVIENYADGVNRSRVGYEYSTAQQQRSVLITSGATDPVVLLSGAGNGSIAYFRILWRPYTPGPPTLSEKSKQLLTNSLASLTIE